MRLLYRSTLLYIIIQMHDAHECVALIQLVQFRTRRIVFRCVTICIIIYTCSLVTRTSQPKILQFADFVFQKFVLKKKNIYNYSVGSFLLTTSDIRDYQTRLGVPSRIHESLSASRNLRRTCSVVFVGGIGARIASPRTSSHHSCTKECVIRVRVCVGNHHQSHGAVFFSV